MKQQTTKLLWCALSLVAALAVGGLLFWIGTSGDTVTEVAFTRDITVADGVASPEQYGHDLTVEKDGRYRMDVEWRAAPGLITGVRLTDAGGKTAFFTTGECLKAESDALMLQAGEYRVEFFSLTNPEALAAFVMASDPGVAPADAARVTNSKGEISSAADYPFRADGTWQVECTYTLERESVLSARAAGVIAGAVFGLVLAAVILTVTKKDGTGKAQYDERQQLARGKGYRNGFWTSFCYLGLWLILDVADIEIPIQTSVLAFIGILLAGYVFVATCIHTDAYFALNENRKRTSLCLLFIGVGNIALGVGSVISGRAVENGVLTFRCINLLCGIFLAAIGVAVFIRKRRADREEDAE